MSKTRVLIVDDSAYSRQIIRRTLESDKGIEVVGVSSDGIDAMAKTIKIKPDIITLDLEMPEMDGFSFLRWLMKKHPIPVIIVSSYSDSKTVFKALELGAADFIAKPSRIVSANLQNLQQDLLRKVKGIKNFRIDRLSKNLNLLEERTSGISPPEKLSCEIEAIGIGSSTGGPAALKIILSRLPEDFPAGIVISQHMPKGFTASFAERLNGISKLSVREAKDGEEITTGKVLICPGGFHMLFKKRGRRVVTSLKESKTTDKYVPSVDMMMSSLADIYGNKTMGIVLTGMGNDGKGGMLEIKKKGGYTIVESEDTAVVFGMPNEVIKSGAASRVLPLQEIPEELTKLVTKN
ncbi:MAG: chemotaxis response regulator protein-glutamate methylesterase [Nitrospirae bacterium]|nr:chemotaxis response regulator protein-glutamate methylesterase [Nitrospirota bacterium]